MIKRIKRCIKFCFRVLKGDDYIFAFKNKNETIDCTFSDTQIWFLESTSNYLSNCCIEEEDAIKIRKFIEKVEKGESLDEPLEDSPF